MEKITARLRVTNLNVKPFAYIDYKEGECLELRAAGHWLEESDQFPVSLHLTVYPGHGIVPAIGDPLVLTIERPNVVPAD